MKKFYTYLYLRKDETPYYAGKGHGNRAFTHTRHRLKCPKDKSRVIIFPMESESSAFESEVALIELFGRKDNKTGILRNLTNGGEGSAGHIFTLEHRAKLSASLTGHIGNRGFVHTPETRLKMSVAHMGIKPTIETREKRSASLRGKKRSVITCEKIRTARKGKTLSIETRAKLSLIGKGRKFSDKHRENMRIAWEARRART
jgi:hypothetical protein